MKILVVSQYYYPERFKVTELAEELFKLGHEVEVLTGLPNYPEGIVLEEYRKGKNRKQKINGVDVHRVALFGRKTGKINLALNYASFMVNASIKAWFMKSKPDMVLVYQLSPVLMAIPAIVLKRRRKIPLVLYTLDLWPDSIKTLGIKPESLFYRFVERISAWVYRQADAQWVSSKRFTGYLDRFTHKGQDIVYLPQYAEDIFTPSPKAPSDDFVCLFAGNMGKAQSIETILKAAKRLEDIPNIHFELVGAGSDLDRLKGIAQELNLTNVNFAGSHPIEAMPAYYKDADVCLLTLLDDPVISLTLPAKVQTYMASARPIVAAAGGEVADVIRESQGGRCVPSQDDEGLANQILHYYHHRDQVLLDGENARQYVELNFSKQRFIERIKEEIEAVSARRKENV